MTKGGQELELVELLNQEPAEITNGDGKWLVYPNGSRDLVEPSQSWRDKMKVMTDEAELQASKPTTEDYLFDLDLRLTMVEMQGGGI